MPDALISGANGFIGKALIKALRLNNFSISELTRENGDIADSATWDAAPANQLVFHLAARTFVPDSWNNPTAFIHTNTIGTLQALEYCRKHGASLVYVSSYLYGNPTSLPISETAPIHTPNPYALSKKNAEDLCFFYHECYGVNVTIIRPFNLYGEGQKNSFLIPQLIEQAILDHRFHVKDLAPKRDYLHLNDFIRALVATTHLKGLHIINLGSGVSYSVEEIIQTICRLEGENHPILNDNIRRQNEIMDTVADIRVAKKILHWEPDISLETGLLRMLEYHRNLLSSQKGTH
jgi:nucleoside-diphosphate-sugar epimerase